MIILDAGSATVLWQRAVAAVLDHGQPTGPRGLQTLEVVDAHLTLTAPRRRLVSAPPVRVVNAAFAAAETVWILSGADDEWIYTYNQRLVRFADDNVLRGAYGPRLRRWEGQVDQLDQVRRELIDDPASRRAVVQIWNPRHDHSGHKDVPCTLGYWFVRRDGRLDMHTNMRSQDLWLGFCYDVFAATVLHELMAGWVGAELGTYHHHVGSLHLYSEHLDSAAALGQVHASPPHAAEMAPLTLPWNELDRVLRGVVEGEAADSPGWQEFGDVMASYRVHKGGDQRDARSIANSACGPLAEGLLAWYDHLDRAASLLNGDTRLPRLPEAPR